MGRGGSRRLGSAGVLLASREVRAPAAPSSPLGYAS